MGEVAAALLVQVLFCIGPLAAQQLNWESLLTAWQLPLPSTNFRSFNSTSIVWGPELDEVDFNNALHVLNEPVTEETRRAIRAGIESEVLHKDKTSRIINSLVSSRWPNNVVPYRLDAAFSTNDRAVIAAAMQNIMDNTCITYRYKTPEDRDWVEIVTQNVDGCYANVRYIGPGFGAHTLGLQKPGCVYTGVIIHELLHILAVNHEMSRPDRDDYIKVDWLNVQVNMAHNFWKMEWDGMPSGLPPCSDKGLIEPTDFSNCVDGTKVQNYGVPYDFESIMHYSLYAFAVDKTKKTLIPLNSSIPTTNIGEQTKLGPSDITVINKAYGCSATQATNGGGHLQGCGGDLNGTIPSSGNLQWSITGSNNLSIYLNFTKWTCGSGSTCSLEVWSGYGDKVGFKVASFSSNNPPPVTNGLLVPSNRIFIKFDATDPAVDFMASWKCAKVNCCSSFDFSSNDTSGFLSIPYYAENVNGTWTFNGTTYNGRPTYIHSNKIACMWYDVSIIPRTPVWNIANCSNFLNPSPAASTGPLLGLFGLGSSACPYALTTWAYFAQASLQYITANTTSIACSSGVTTSAPEFIESTTTPVPPISTTTVAPVPSECCNIKVAGGVTYNLADYDLQRTGSFMCKDGCIYNRADDTAVDYCFMTGGDNPQPVTECRHAETTTGETTVTGDTLAPA